jgi:hypothetical protein
MMNYNGDGGRKIAFGLLLEPQKGIIFKSIWDVFGL